MELLVVGVGAFTVSIVTLYSGFGLGTLLMPVFALFMPIDVAVAATALVHAGNNVVKVLFFGIRADAGLVLRFGLPALAASFAGAWVLTLLSGSPPIASYMLGETSRRITPLGLSMGSLILLFALAELIPRFRDLRMDRSWLIPGGILSGFFGGFSGHQGALRSIFLVRTGGTPVSFVATNAVIGMMVDVARLVVYGWAFVIFRYTGILSMERWPLVAMASAGALLGVVFGKRFLHKATMSGIRTATGVLLLVIGLALASGLI